MPDAGLHRHRMHPGPRQCGGELAERPFQVIRVDVIGGVGADHLLGLVAQDPFDRRAHVPYGAVGVGDHDDVQRILDEGVEALVAPWLCSFAPPVAIGNYVRSSTVLIHPLQAPVDSSSVPSRGNRDRTRTFIGLYLELRVGLITASFVCHTRTHDDVPGDVLKGHTPAGSKPLRRGASDVAP